MATAGDFHAALANLADLVIAGQRKDASKDI